MGMITSTVAALLLMAVVMATEHAEYRPYLLEDTREWSSDPLVWESGKNLPANITSRNGDGTVDVIVTDRNGDHFRPGVRVLEGLDLHISDGGNGVIITKIDLW